MDNGLANSADANDVASWVEMHRGAAVLVRREMARLVVAPVEVRQGITAQRVPECKVVDTKSNHLWALWVIAPISPRERLVVF
jgi:hypothetical protein